MEIVDVQFAAAVMARAVRFLEDPFSSSVEERGAAIGEQGSNIRNHVWCVPAPKTVGVRYAPEATLNLLGGPAVNAVGDGELPLPGQPNQSKDDHHSFWPMT